jgi:type I restriction enzyme, S subunit
VSGLQFVQLKDCCNVVGGATPKRNIPEFWGRGVPWVTPKDVSKLDSPFLEDAPEYISQAGYESCSTYLLPKHSILLTSRAPIGNVAITGRDMCTNQGFKSLVPRDGVNFSYLYHCIKYMSPKLQALGNGATFKEISKKVVEEFEIPLPPLEEQKRIAAILDKADALRRKRQQAIELTDQLLRSVFLDIFGDPVTNPKGWKEGCLGDAVHFAKDGPHVSPKYSEIGIPFLSTRHVKTTGIVWDDLKYISPEEAAIQWKKCKPQYDDVLYSKGGTTGIASHVDFHKEFAVWVHVALLRPDGSVVNPVWLTAMLNSAFCYAQSQSYTHGATNKDLGLKRMIKIKMYIPPLEEQDKYAEFTKKLKARIDKYNEDLQLLENLFLSLTQQAFRGELTKQTEAA